MSWNEKFRAKSFTEAAERLVAVAAVPDCIPRAVRELAAHAPHFGEDEAVKNVELEVATSGHVDQTSFQASLSVQFVALPAAKK